MSVTFLNSDDHCMLFFLFFYFVNLIYVLVLDCQMSHVFYFIFHLNVFFPRDRNCSCPGHVDFSGINSRFPKVSL